MAASVPRFLRQSRLAYLPLKCVIGSRLIQGEGSNLYFDIVMLPVPEFQRMRGNVGLQHVNAPALKAGPTFNPGFVLTDAKQVIVPDNEPNPEAFAKNHFLVLFGLIAPDVPTETTEQPQFESFSEIAKKCTAQIDKYNTRLAKS